LRGKTVVLDNRSFPKAQGVVTNHVSFVKTSMTVVG